MSSKQFVLESENGGYVAKDPSFTKGHHAKTVDLRSHELVNSLDEAQLFDSVDSALASAIQAVKYVEGWEVNSYFMIWNALATAPAGLGAPVVSAVLPASPTVTQSMVTARAVAVMQANQTATPATKVRNEVALFTMSITPKDRQLFQRWNGR